jgi:hypothetical protein
MWTQVPAVPIRNDPAGLTLALPDEVRVRVPRSARRISRDLAMMASFPRTALGAALPALVAHGIVGPEDLPQVVIPEAPAALDGWRFA